MNELDGFERSVRESLDQYEVPYNSADWSAMERSLSGAGKGRWLGGAGLIAALIAGTMLVGGTTWYLVDRNNTVPGEGSAQVQQQQSKGGEAGNSTAADRTNIGDDTTLNGGSNTQQTAESTENTAKNAENTNAANTGTSEQNTSSAQQVASVTNADQRSNTAANGQRSNTERANSTSTKGKADGSRSNGDRAAVTKETINTTGSSASRSSEVTFRASVNEGCPGTAVDFKVEHMPEKGIYLWNFGDGSFSNKANPEHTFTKPGRYQVMLSMSAEGMGAIHNKPSSDVIVIHEAPRAAFNVVKQEYEGHLPSVHFENRSTAAKSYHWNFADGGTSTVAHPDHIFKKKGVYPVELTVTNEIGCTHTYVKEVRIDKDYNLDAATSFSPNGDGKDESFIPEALRNLGAKFQMTIYNGNGEVVYQTADASKPWLGRLNNRGEACAEGEYVWVVDVKESIHLAETYTGNVKLIR